MAAREAVDARCVGVRDPLLEEQSLRLVLRQVRDRQRLEQATERRGPGGHRGVPARQHDSEVGSERGDEREANPVVDEPERLVRVEDEEYSGSIRRKSAANDFEIACRNAARGCDRIERSLLGRLYGAAVELHDFHAGRPSIRGDGVDERRLPDACQTVHEHDQRLVPVDETEERTTLTVATDELPRPLSQQSVDRASHPGESTNTPRSLLVTPCHNRFAPSLGRCRRRHQRMGRAGASTASPYAQTAWRRAVSPVVKAVCVAAVVPRRSRPRGQSRASRTRGSRRRCRRGR